MINKRNKIVIGIALGVILYGVVWAFLRSDPAEASPIVFNFSSPSFSGVGQSSYYNTIENGRKPSGTAVADESSVPASR